MSGTRTNRQGPPDDRLGDLLDALAEREGTQETTVPGVRLTRRSVSERRHPAVYEPMIVFLGRGRKRSYLGDEEFFYDPSRYLALSVPVPVECEFEASAGEPLLAISLEVEPAMLAEILLGLDDPAPPDRSVPRGIYCSALSPALRDAVVRLAECLCSLSDSRILGRSIVREIVYRVLQDETGGALRALATRNDQFMRISRVVQRIHADFAQSMSVDELARQAGMSVSTFHHSFKAVTGTSPLQYLKNIRLHRARLLMVHAGHNAGTAAAAVGYESASQFGREFKRVFGASPGEEAAAARDRLSAGIEQARDLWAPVAEYH